MLAEWLDGSMARWLARRLAQWMDGSLCVSIQRDSTRRVGLQTSSGLRYYLTMAKTADDPTKSVSQQASQLGRRSAAKRPRFLAPSLCTELPTTCRLQPKFAPQLHASSQQPQQASPDRPARSQTSIDNLPMVPTTTTTSTVKRLQ